MDSDSDTTVTLDSDGIVTDSNDDDILNEWIAKLKCEICGENYKPLFKAGDCPENYHQQCLNKYCVTNQTLVCRQMECRKPFTRVDVHYENNDALVSRYLMNTIVLTFLLIIWLAIVIIGYYTQWCAILMLSSAIVLIVMYLSMFITSYSNFLPLHRKILGVSANKSYYFSI